jgi:hypothetical protein
MNSASGFEVAYVPPIGFWRERLVPGFKLLNTDKWPKKVSRNEQKAKTVQSTVQYYIIWGPQLTNPYKIDGPLLATTSNSKIANQLQC